MASKLRPDDYYRIERRIADVETVKNEAWRKIEQAKVYARRDILDGAAHVWRVWHAFSASRWV